MTNAQKSDVPFRYRIKPEELGEIATGFGIRMRDLLLQHWKLAAFLLVRYVDTPDAQESNEGEPEVTAETSGADGPDTGLEETAEMIEKLAGAIKGELAAWKGFCGVLNVDPAAFAEKTASDEAEEFATMFGEPPASDDARRKCLEQLRSYWNHFAEQARAAG